MLFRDSLDLADAAWQGFLLKKEELSLTGAMQACYQSSPRRPIRADRFNYLRPHLPTLTPNS
ncbi:hypothetical protein XavaCFBP5823_08135 [Xanthomonas axonopodis pv. vasculorum]|nr:hypothetical protein XavaCFBP5823_08135 [Xanthomonas axonopodis pv. vasculorum]